jgi:hypothetical protein
LDLPTFFLILFFINWTGPRSFYYYFLLIGPALAFQNEVHRYGDPFDLSGADPFQVGVRFGRKVVGQGVNVMVIILPIFC